MEPSMPLVVILGLATVFVVLICIILMIKLMSVIINAVNKEDDADIAPQPVPISNVQAAVPAPAPVNQSMVVAAIAAAIAEDMGTEVSHLRIHSIRRI